MKSFQHNLGNKKQMNKNGIRVITSTSTKSRSRGKRQLELHKLDFQEFAEFVGYEQGIEVKIVVPAYEPIIEAVSREGWTFIKKSKGEIA